MMDVTVRNFFRLLRAGAFGERETIEPLSAWKWGQLFQFAQLHSVSALVYDGVSRCSDQFFMQLPAALDQQWAAAVKKTEAENRTMNIQLSDLFGQLAKEQTRPMLLKGQGIGTYYDNPLHRTAGNIDLFFPFETQAKKADAWVRQHATDIDTSEKRILQYTWNGVKAENHHRAQQLTNTLHNRTLQNIIEEEIRQNTPEYVVINGSRVETIPPTLALLLTLIRIVRYIINDGISIKQIVDLGIFLRKNGHRVDFIKLQTWIEKLRLTQFAQLEGALLVQLMAFTEDEIPFMTGQTATGIDDVMKELFRLRNSQTDDWHFEQGQGVFVHTANSSAMLGQVRRSARYFRYYPSESFTNFFVAFAHSLSHIEE